MPDSYNYGEDIPYEVIPESKDQNYKRDIWNAAMGLQAVDGLKPSKYLKDLAEENISGHKTYDDINSELEKSYGTEFSHQKEADIVSCRIAQVLEQTKFELSCSLLKSIHAFLFEGVFESKDVGEFRNYNFRKSEKILFGDTVRYSDHISIKNKLKDIIDAESTYVYSKPMTENDIEHLSQFTSRIWQVHPFCEGNTRTTAVFIELYLVSLGFEVNNEPFENNSLYFRNALVRSCYESETYDAKPTYSFLNHFYKNLLCESDYILDSFDLFISNKEDINYTKTKSDHSER